MSMPCRCSLGAISMPCRWHVDAIPPPSLSPGGYFWRRGHLTCLAHLRPCQAAHVALCRGGLIPVATIPHPCCGVVWGQLRGSCATVAPAGQLGSCPRGFCENLWGGGVPGAPVDLKRGYGKVSTVIENRPNGLTGMCRCKSRFCPFAAPR